MTATIAGPPTVLALEPDTAEAGSGQFIIAIKGENFTMHSQVFIGDEGKATGMLGPDLLTAQLDPALYEAGSYPVMVQTGNVMSNTLYFTFTEPENPDG